MLLLKTITISHESFETLQFFLCVNQRCDKSSNKFNNNATNSKSNNNTIVKTITNEINETFSEAFNKKSQFAFILLFVSISFQSDY